MEKGGGEGKAGRRGILTNNRVGDEVPLLVLDDLLNRRVNDPVQGTRVVAVKLVLERDALLVDVDGLAHRHGIDENFGDLGLVLIRGQLVALVLEGLVAVQEGDEGRAGRRTGDRAGNRDGVARGGVHGVCPRVVVSFLSGLGVVAKGRKLRGEKLGGTI